MGGLGGMVLQAGIFGAIIGFGVSAIVNVGKGLWDLKHARDDLQRANTALARATRDLAVASACVAAAATPAEVAASRMALDSAREAFAAAEAAVVTAQAQKPDWQAIVRSILIDTAVAAVSGAAAMAIVGVIFGSAAIPGGLPGIIIALAVGFAVTVAVKKIVLLLFPGYALDPKDSARDRERAAADDRATKLQRSMEQHNEKLDNIVELQRENRAVLEALRRQLDGHERRLSRMDTMAA